MRIYISGPITNNPDFKKDFEEAERRLKEKGFEPVNPAKTEIEDGTWKDYMKADIKQLVDCDGIYMLSGWSKSRGARLERSIAIELDMQVTYALLED